MKLSLNWIKEYTPVDIDTDQLAQKIGAQLGAVEDVIELGEMYKGAIIVRVVECLPHPKADKLSVCKINDGRKVDSVERDSSGLIQIICGAPNVKTGMCAVWLPPGTTVPASFKKDPMVLEAKEIRGIVSSGMLASPKELAIGDSHEGLLEIDDNVSPGESFAERYGLNDTIIDIENKMFTHRPDLFGQIGLAREVAGITGTAFHSPDWYLKPKDLNLTKGSRSLEVKNEIPDLVPRFMVQVVKGIKVKPSSPKIQSYLSRTGLRPINNIVDLTNYFMMLTAQPMHAYDLDKLKKLDGSDKASIVVRKPNQNEDLKLLNGKTIKLSGSDIVIASAGQAIGLGGVMGGADTEVDEDTRNIAIECACFDMYAIRRSAMAHGLSSDAVTRFNKGQSPYQNDRILAEIVDQILQEAGGEAEAPIDIQTTLPKPVSLNVNRDFVNERLGSELSLSQMSELLTNVEFEVERGDNELSIKVPFWRTDIHIAEDVVEEIGRLFGYENLKLNLPSRTIQPALKNATFDFNTKVRQLLVRAGANELLTYSFVHGRLLEQVGQSEELAFQVANALSPDLQFYRLSLLPNLLEKVHPNIKAGFQEFCLFEINKTHIKNVNDEAEPSLPAEQYRLALVVAVDEKLAKSSYSGAAYYQAKFYLDYLLYALGIEYQLKKFEGDLGNNADNQLSKPFEALRSSVIEVNGQRLGMVGEPSLNVKENLKLPSFTSMIELDIQKLFNYAKNPGYVKLSNFPFVEQDICFKLPSTVAYQDLADLLNAELSRLASGSHFVLSPLDMFEREDDKANRQITFRLRLNSYEKTLTSEEVNALISSLGLVAKERFNAAII